VAAVAVLTSVVASVVALTVLPGSAGLTLLPGSAGRPGAEGPAEPGPPLSASGTAPGSPVPASSGAPAPPVIGDCATVQAASGLTLLVLDVVSDDVGGARAEQLVRDFQARIAGQQPAGSTQPVSASVQGWLCVSAPPATQGGTTCTLRDKTVYARVVSR
jgi:hypothetical protein